jgi:hypothetical protein
MLIILLKNMDLINIFAHPYKQKILIKLPWLNY